LHTLTTDFCWIKGHDAKTMSLDPAQIITLISSVTDSTDLFHINQVSLVEMVTSHSVPQLDLGAVIAQSVLQIGVLG
jgi:hypothetical protein